MLCVETQSGTLQRPEPRSEGTIVQILEVIYSHILNDPAPSWINAVISSTNSINRNKIMKTPLITKQGYEKLKKELDYLWRVERPEVTKIVTWAANLGDRSENADYQYNKKRLREIDRRVRYLQKRLDSLKIVDHHPDQEGKVFFGAWVEIENDAGETLRFRIAGYDEIFDRKDTISVDSPMARALLKKEVGDEAVVKTEAGVFAWYVNSIEYEK